MDTLGARDFSCMVSSVSQVFMVTCAKVFSAALQLVTSAFSLRSVGLKATCDKKPLVPRALMEGLWH